MKTDVEKLTKIHDLQRLCEIVNGEVFHLTMEEKINNTSKNPLKGRRHYAHESSYNDHLSNPSVHNHLASVPLATLARQFGRTFQLLFRL